MGKIASLVLYLSVFCLSSALFGYGVYRKNKVMKWAGIIPPLLLASLRYGVGTDYGTYESLFNHEDHWLIIYKIRRRQSLGFIF